MPRAVGCFGNVPGSANSQRCESNSPRPEPPPRGEVPGRPPWSSSGVWVRLPPASERAQRVAARGGKPARAAGPGLGHGDGMVLWQAHARARATGARVRARVLWVRRRRVLQLVPHLRFRAQCCEPVAPDCCCVPGAFAFQVQTISDEKPIPLAQSLHRAAKCLVILLGPVCSGEVALPHLRRARRAGSR